MVASPLHCGGRRTGCRCLEPARHGSERPDQGIPQPWYIYLSTRPEPQDDRRRGRVLLYERSQMEPDERVFLPSARSRRHAGTGTRFCSGNSNRRSGRSETARSGRGFPQGCRAHFFLCERGHPVCDRDVQDACLCGSLGRDLSRKIRRRRRQVSPVPLWRAGEQPGPDRAAARKQRVPHPDRDAGGNAIEKSTRARRAIACVERSARFAPSVGSAMVHADATDYGV